MPFAVHPHMLRHACGYKLANDGHDTRALQRADVNGSGRDSDQSKANGPALHAEAMAPAGEAPTAQPDQPAPSVFLSFQKNFVMAAGNKQS
jgi:hypothetical protein